jgi:hypothetical protein
VKALLKLLALSALLGALHGTLASEPSAPVRISTMGQFLDVDLPISEIREGTGFVGVVAHGDIQGTTVGFEVDFPTSEHSGIHPPLALGKARIRSVGADSDRFVAFLAQRYGLSAPANGMVQAVDASIAALEGDPAHPMNARANIKFFFYDSGPDDRYAEVYINVDPKGRMLEFHEKDPEYRKPLLLALTKGP